MKSKTLCIHYYLIRYSEELVCFDLNETVLGKLDVDSWFRSQSFVPLCTVVADELQFQ